MHILRFVIGAILIPVGIAGIVLPALPGWLLIFVGIELVGLGFLIPVPIRKLMEKLKRRFF